MDKIMRRKTRTVNVGGVKIGSGHDISIQSMCSRDSHDFEAVYRQTKSLVNAGCEIVRIAVPDRDCVGVFEYIKSRGITVPLVADIHFDYRLAILSAEAGADKVRVNPGNLGEIERLYAVADACMAHGTAMRVGVNGGSAEKKYVAKYGGVTPQALADSALSYVDALDTHGFHDIVVSVKSSNVKTMTDAVRFVARGSDVPLHIGVTEAGSVRMGTIKNAVGIGALLTDGIGDTVRVSLTAPPEDEVYAARDILSACGYSRGGVEIVSCPTCGRTAIDLFGILKSIEDRIPEIDTHGFHIKAAVMGCVVNGPGEARDADVGIAGGRGEAVLFRHGEIVGKIREDMAAYVLISEIEKTISEKVKEEGLNE